MEGWLEKFAQGPRWDADLFISDPLALAAGRFCAELSRAVMADDGGKAAGEAAGRMALELSERLGLGCGGDGAQAREKVLLGWSAFSEACDPVPYGFHMALGWTLGQAMRGAREEGQGLESAVAGAMGLVGSTMTDPKSAEAAPGSAARLCSGLEALSLEPCVGKGAASRGRKL